jgi:hypothetical protein
VTSTEVSQLPELAFNPFVLRVAEVIEDESEGAEARARLGCQGEMDGTMFLQLLSVFHYATPGHEKMHCTSPSASVGHAPPRTPRAVRRTLTTDLPASRSRHLTLLLSLSFSAQGRSSALTTTETGSFLARTSLRPSLLFTRRCP